MGMRFALRTDGSRPSRTDEDCWLFEVLGTQDCDCLFRLRNLFSTWSAALGAADLPDAKIKLLWDHTLAARPLSSGDEDDPSISMQSWTTVSHEHRAEYYALVAMLDFMWTALRLKVRLTRSAASNLHLTHGPCACRRGFTARSTPLASSSQVASSKWCRQALVTSCSLLTGPTH